VLYQKTRDGRVASFCRNLGFTVREIAPAEVVALSDAVRFRLGVHGHDSWSYIETPQHTYLNMNDCVPVAAFHRKLAGRLPRGVDVLLTQFSYANWVANPGDGESMAAAAARKRAEMRLQIDAYKPKVLIPFASFTWFCRADNFHQNAGANTISDIYETFSKLAPECVVLYPGDWYQVGKPHDSSTAIARYAADLQKIAPLSLADGSYSAEELESLSARQRKELRAQNGMWSLWLLARAGMIKPFAVYLSDLRRSLRFSLPDGIAWTDVPREKCDMVLSSASFALMLQNGYGYATVDIGGRIIVQNPAFRALLRRNFIASRYNERGYSFPAVFLSPWFLRSQLQRRLG
jgi:UDP-MurNAc hydroxylase